MKKSDIKGLAKQLTALMLTAAMVLGSVGGGIESTAASQNSAAVTAVEEVDKSADDTADADNAENVVKQSKSEANTESKTEQAAESEYAAQQSDGDQSSKDSQLTTTANTVDNVSNDNSESDKESAVKDTADANASDKADAKDAEDSEQSSADSDSTKDNTVNASDAKQTSEQTVVSPAKDGKADAEKDADNNPEKEAELGEAFSEFKTVDGVIITVTAPEGVVPTGTKLHAKKVSKQATLDKVNEAIGEVSESENTVEPDYVFDIKLIYDGEEIEPDTSYGDVNVTFTLDKKEVKDSDKISVYHIPDKEEILTANKIDDLKVNQDTLPDIASKTQLAARKEITSISFDTESFSLWAVSLSSLVEDETCTVTFDYGEKVYYENPNNENWIYLSEDGSFGETSTKDDAESKAASAVKIQAPSGQPLNTWVHDPEYYRYDDNGALKAVFEGWKNEEQGIILTGDEVPSYIPTEDITFKADWNTTIYKVTLDLTDKVIFVDRGCYYYFDENGWQKEADSQEYAVEKASRYITTYVASNHSYEEGLGLNRYTALIGDNKARFVGWKAEDGTVKETIEINSVSSDKTFTASWDTDLVKVEYNLGDKIVWEYDFDGYTDIKYYCINAEGAGDSFTTEEEAEKNACDSLTVYVRKNTALGDNDISEWKFTNTAVTVADELVMFDGWRSDNGQIVGSYDLSDYIPTADTVFNATWTNKLYKVELDFTDKVVLGGDGYYCYVTKYGGLGRFQSDWKNHYE